MDPDREPLSPNRAAMSDARGAHNINVHDPAYNKPVQAAQPGVQAAGPGIQEPQKDGAHTGPRKCYAADTDPDKLDYVSITSMVTLVVVMIVLLATVHYAGILFLLALAPALFLMACCYGAGAARQSVRINDLVRSYWMGLLLAVPVAVVEGACVTKWWNSAGQPDYIPWGPSRAMSLGWSIGAAFFISFLVYGWFENTLKYIIVRAHYNRAIFYTPYGLPLIGMAAALGFATVENLVFILLYGFVGAIIRGVIVVPFQAVIGLIIGTLIARHKYIQADGQPARNAGFGLYLKTILLPFVLTGLFELPFMVILMRHKLYTNWAYWLLGSLGVLIVSYIIYLILSRPLRRATVVS
jgi:RsiW-degrading membrane proteinase PrsW (M82 family)